MEHSKVICHDKLPPVQLPAENPVLLVHQPSIVIIRLPPHLPIPQTCCARERVRVHGLRSVHRLPYLISLHLDHTLSGKLVDTGTGWTVSPNHGDCLEYLEQVWSFLRELLENGKSVDPIAISANDCIF